MHISVTPNKSKSFYIQYLLSAHMVPPPGYDSQLAMR